MNAGETEKHKENRRPDGTFAQGNHPPTEWSPGYCPNKNGRRNAWSDVIDNKLSAPLENGKTGKEELTDILFAAARKGDLEAIKILLDRNLGKPRQAVDLGVQQDNLLAMAQDVFKFQIIDSKNDIITSQASAVSTEQQVV